MNANTKPQNIKYTTSHGYEITLDDPKKLVEVQGYPCIDGGKVKREGKMTKLVVRLDNKPELAAKVEAWKAEWATYKAAKAAEFARNVPGLDELKKARTAAYNEQARYDYEFDRMMDTGHSISPKAVYETLQAKAAQLAGKYPRAAMYLRAQAYTRSSNSNKYGAGEDAKEIIATGGILEEAEAILDNWVDRFIPVWGR